jgi:hypothetical protein
MVKVFRAKSPFSILLILSFLGIIFFVGLPLMLAAAAGLLLFSAVKRVFLGPKPSSPLFREQEENPHISPIIHNEKIGSYRVIENPNDPDIIEVEKL